jgi:hypothetical protein
MSCGERLKAEERPHDDPRPGPETKTQEEDDLGREEVLHPAHRSGHDLLSHREERCS